MRHGLLARGAGRDLADWLIARRQRFAPHRAPPIWHLRYQSFWFERLLKMQTRQENAAQGGNPGENDPRFVMGFWRSGTTLLHNLLYAGWNCRTPLTWECFSPASFRLERPPSADSSTRRPMDEGLVHLLGPQEDEFALLLLGEPSLYRAFLDPKLLHTPAAEMEQDARADLPRWRRFIAQFSNDSPNPVLLKSPNHVFRLSSLEQWYPSAQYVWIGRPFADVLKSNRRMWAAMIDLHAVTTHDQSSLDAFLTTLGQRYRDVLARLAEGPDLTVLWVDFGNLVHHPERVTADAAAFLGLTKRSATDRVANVDTIVRDRSDRSTDEKLPPRMLHLADEIDHLQERARTRFSTIGPLH